jgi:hypothetical protein
MVRDCEHRYRFPTLCPVAQVVEWCTAEKRTFLRQRIQSKLAFLMFRNEQYQEVPLLARRVDVI